MLCLHLVRLCRRLELCGHLLQRLALHANISTDGVHAVSHDHALFCVDFHFICQCSVYRSVGEVLKFTIAATHKINVTGKSYFAYAPSTIGDRCVVVMECFLRDLLWEQVEQDG